MVKRGQQQLAVGGLTSLFTTTSSNSNKPQQWHWPSCGLQQPRTLSFRQPPPEQQEEDAALHHDYKMTMNSAYSVDSFSTASEEVMPLPSGGGPAPAVVDATEAEAEAVIRALRSDRLLFQPEDAVLIKAAKEADDIMTSTAVMSNCNTVIAPATGFGGATAMSVKSQNPYRDFRESMEEMVRSKRRQKGGLNDWRWLEEMLGWYLSANGKSTHGLIVAAFVDLLLDLSATSTDAASSCSSPSSPATPNDCCCSSSSSSSGCL